MPSRTVKKKIAVIQDSLRQLRFPDRFNTDQTAHCVLAMADGKPRKGLVLGHATLREGSRIHDMIEFARVELDMDYAENTRESIRKSSCKQLVDHGLAVANPDDPARLKSTFDFPEGIPFCLTIHAPKHYLSSIP